MRLKEIYERYKDKMEFIFIYNRDPHAIDGWWLGQSRILKFFHSQFDSRANIDIRQSKTDEERIKAAVKCRNALLGDIPLYVDKIDDRVRNLYTSQPTRIYIIGKNGKVVYNPGIGPYSFNPEYLEPEIIKYLEQIR